MLQRSGRVRRADTPAWPPPGGSRRGRLADGPAVSGGSTRASGAPVARGRPAGLARRTILVVGGDDSARAVLVSLLRAQPDLTAAGAATVEEALWFLRGIRVHLVLLDVRASDADGLALIRRLRSDPAPWGIPLIALAPAPIPYSEQAARLAGCAAVLADPANPEVLVEAVRTVLDDRAIRR